MNKFPHVPTTSSPRTPIPQPQPPPGPGPPPQPPPPVQAELQMESAWRIGRYTKAERKLRIERYRQKRARRDYSAKVLYECRKKIADRRLRVHGRFVKHDNAASSTSTPTSSTPGGSGSASGGGSSSSANVASSSGSTRVHVHHNPMSYNVSGGGGCGSGGVDLSEEFLNIPDDASTTR